MLTTHVFALANRSMKKLLLAGVLLGCTSAQATNVLVDTGDADRWMVKYLGTSSDWESERSYVNGVLDTTGYSQAQAVHEDPAWIVGIPWISPARDTFGPAGYYSYATTISIPDAGPTESFSGLSIRFSADNLVTAFVINGVAYDGFTEGSDVFTYTGYEDIFIPSNGNISWNVGGNNVIEIGIYNDGGPTGLSATIQASYAPVPEPETWAMLLAGLGIVSVVTRRRIKRQ